MTTLATVTPGHRARADLVARRDGVVAGVPLAVAAFQLLDPHVEVRVDAPDGRAVRKGDKILHLSGSARGLLSTVAWQIATPPALDTRPSRERRRCSIFREAPDAVRDAGIG